MSFEFNVRMGEKGLGFTLSVDGITMAQVDQVATMIENVLTSKKDDIARILKEGADKINEAVEKAKKAEDTSEDPQENDEEKEPNKRSITGKTFVVSGNCTTFKSKKDLEDYLTAHGGKVSASVTADTDAVICSYSNTSAFRIAKECGIPIFSEHKFLTEFLQGDDVRNYLKTSVITF